MRHGWIPSGPAQAAKGTWNRPTVTVLSLVSIHDFDGPWVGLPVDHSRAFGSDGIGSGCQQGSCR